MVRTTEPARKLDFRQYDLIGQLPPLAGITLPLSSSALRPLKHVIYHTIFSFMPALDNDLISTARSDL